MAQLVGEEIFPSIAKSVTRNALISLQDGFERLLCGVDSLDLGLYVDWPVHWPLISERLQNFKEQAAGKKGLIDQTPDGRQFLHCPSSKPPRYRFHLQFPEYHIFIAITNHAETWPNVYLSFNSEALWALGVQKAVDLVTHDLSHFGAKVNRIQPSRVDLNVDYYIPGDLTLDFLMQHKVCRSRGVSHYADDTILETFYAGAPGGDIRLRIYDKGKEIAKKGKLWFLPLWGKESPDCIWRIEFQIRRPVLKDFGINTLENLLDDIGGLWTYLTGDWFSLREQDNEQQNRRTVLPWWEDVQDAGYELGPSIKLNRQPKGEMLASVEWYVSHISGCLASYAAKLGIEDFNDAVNHLCNDICQYWFNKNFKEELVKRMIMQGRAPTGGNDENKAA